MQNLKMPMKCILIVTDRWMSLFSTRIIEIMFGSEYIVGATALSIFVMGCSFVSLVLFTFNFQKL